MVNQLNGCSYVVRVSLRSRTSGVTEFTSTTATGCLAVERVDLAALVNLRGIAHEVGEYTYDDHFVANFEVVGLRDSLSTETIATVNFERFTFSGTTLIDVTDEVSSVAIRVAWHVLAVLVTQLCDDTTNVNFVRRNLVLLDEFQSRSHVVGVFGSTRTIQSFDGFFLTASTFIDTELLEFPCRSSL